MYSDHNNDQSIASPAAPDTEAIREQLSTAFAIDPVCETAAADEEVDCEWTVAEVAAYLHKSPRQVQRLMRAGVLSARKVNGRKGPEWRINRSDVKRSASAYAFLSAVDRTEVLTRLAELESRLQAVSEELASMRQYKDTIDRILMELNDMKDRYDLAQNEPAGSTVPVHELRRAVGVLADDVKRQRENLGDSQKQSWWQRVFPGQT